MRGTCAQSLHLFLANAVNRENTKTIGKRGKLSKNHFTCVQWRTDACRCMVSRDPRTNVHEIGGTSLEWPDPPTSPNFVALWQKVCEIAYLFWKNVAHQEIRPKFTLGYQICHQSIGRTQVYFLQTLCSNFGSIDWFVSEISLVLYRKCHFCTYGYTPPLSPKIWRCFCRVRSIGSVLHSAKCLG